MKAIQIKFLPATNTKPSRLKAWTEAGSIIQDISGRFELEMEAKFLADRYARQYCWPDISDFATLPNGDYVATLMSK